MNRLLVDNPAVCASRQPSPKVVRQLTLPQLYPSLLARHRVPSPWTIRQLPQRSMPIAKTLFVRRLLDEETSEISFSASSVSGMEKIPTLVPGLPLEAAGGAPFECPFCFTIISVQTLQAWM